MDTCLRSGRSRRTSKEVAPGLCVLELDWKGCLWLGENTLSLEAKKGQECGPGERMETVFMLRH